MPQGGKGLGCPNQLVSCPVACPKPGGIQDLQERVLRSTVTRIDQAGTDSFRCRCHHWHTEHPMYGCQIGTKGLNLRASQDQVYPIGFNDAPPVSAQRSEATACCSAEISSSRSAFACCRRTTSRSYCSNACETRWTSLRPMACSWSHSPSSPNEAAAAADHLPGKPFWRRLAAHFRRTSSWF
jgi:hypothetical protein